MSITRKIERNKLKKKYKSNKIRKAWRTEQINKYSIKGYCDMYNKNNPKKQDKLTPKEAYSI